MLGSLEPCGIQRMGGSSPLRSIRCISQNFSIRPISAAARCFLAWVYFFVMAVLAFVFEVVRVQTYLWVIAVNIIQPYLMVDDLARLIPAYLTQSAINSFPVCDIAQPRPAPWSAQIKLFLCHVLPSL